MTRVCSATGVALVAGPVAGFRIAQDTYGPLSPPPRTSGSTPRDDWSRWDIPGSTVYVAEDQSTAFRECLAWARMTGNHQRKLGKLAALFGITPEEVMREINADFVRLGHMQPGHLPFSWRDERLIHEITVPETAGSWVDIEHHATLDSLSLSVGSLLSDYTGREEVDKGIIYSADREVTTRIAEHLHDLILDDGSQLAGVRFRSRVSDGLCWAFWMRRASYGLTDPIFADNGVPIPDGHPVLKEVTSTWGIRSW